ncbi:phage shock protein A [Paenibacillus shirakamiensis]|uniref:Phage shock protein A n=1 Tax=Paenibacillus shirakamiensis TaxID=1265935 RepID=A0ABS4JJY2_9BACL|nr:PspA/IM30 family protein [Paenibacillus shirakamiensis]MBP2002017.1 phage shock protein A [Paenibacillus shirakamiensis]
MSVFRRVRDITVATFNERLEQAQDPVQLIDQFLGETRREIADAEKLQQQVGGHTRQLKQQVDHAQTMLIKREDQALLALKAGEEHLAKLALQEKLLYEEKMEQYTELYQQSLESLQQLENQLHELKSEYQAVYSKRQYYHARMETLRLQQRMNERMGSHGTPDVPKMFNRLEDRVSGMEWEARSLRDLRRTGQDLVNEASSAIQSTLEQELSRLRQKLNKRGEE